MPPDRRGLGASTPFHDGSWLSIAVLFHGPAANNTSCSPPGSHPAPGVRRKPASTFTCAALQRQLATALRGHVLAAHLHHHWLPLLNAAWCRLRSSARPAPCVPMQHDCATRPRGLNPEQRACSSLMAHWWWWAARQHAPLLEPDDRVHACKHSSLAKRCRDNRSCFP